MWRLVGQIPNDCCVAVSGGADSMSLLHFVSQVPARRVRAIMFDHGTGFHELALPVVEAFCRDLGVDLIVSPPGNRAVAGKSPEEHWRDERYAWLSQFETVLTGHNLDDVVETWIWSSLHGTPKLIPYSRGNVRRPLLAVSRDDILSYAEHHAVPYIKDPANEDRRYRRSIVRHDILPHALEVNPGLHSVIRKKVLERGIRHRAACGQAYGEE